MKQAPKKKHTFSDFSPLFFTLEALFFGVSRTFFRSSGAFGRKLEREGWERKPFYRKTFKKSNRLLEPPPRSLSLFFPFVCFHHQKKKERKKKIAHHNPPEQVSYSTVVQFFISSGDSWMLQNTGAVSLASQGNGNFLKIIDLEVIIFPPFLFFFSCLLSLPNQTTLQGGTVLFTQELYENFRYEVLMPFFHSFEASEAMVGESHFPCFPQELILLQVFPLQVKLKQLNCTSM
jgi:hypothetical protein